MERINVPSGKHQLDGETTAMGAVADDWVFTKSEKEEIRRTFKLTLRDKISKEKIDAFIYHLESICQIKKTLMEQSKKVDARDIRERILTDCKVVLKHLSKINQGRTYPLHIDTIDYYEEEGDFDNDFIFQILDLSEEAFSPLEKFVKVLEEYHKLEVIRSGRSPADSDHFVRRVKDLYIEHIGEKPTAYTDGCFFTIVQRVLEAVGLPSKDPSKTIRAALKET